jgi:hypothetical protein
MSVTDFMRCNFVTDKDQLIHVSGSLINGPYMAEGSWVQCPNHHENTQDQT